MSTSLAARGRDWAHEACRTARASNRAAGRAAETPSPDRAGPASRSGARIEKSSRAVASIVRRGDASGVAIRQALNGVVHLFRASGRLPTLAALLPRERGDR